MLFTVLLLDNSQLGTGLSQLYLWELVKDIIVKVLLKTGRQKQPEKKTQNDYYLSLASIKSVAFQYFKKC